MKYIVTIIIIAILMVSNPKLQDHQYCVKAKVNNLIRNSISSENNSTSLFAELGVWVGDSVADSLVKNVIKRKDFLLFSLTSFEFNGINKIIGVGILGHVFISDKVDQELENSKDKLISAVNDISPSNKSGNSVTYESDNQSEMNTYDYTPVDESNYYYVNASEDSPVYFYSEPDYSYRKQSYFTTRELIMVQEIKNDFAYVEFTNSNNQISKGWLPLSDLLKN